MALLELIGGRLLNLEALKGLGELRLDVGLVLPLDLGANFRGSDYCWEQNVSTVIDPSEHRAGRTGGLDLRNVRLELLLRLVLGGEVLVGLLERLGVLDHLVDLGRREATDRVGDGDVGLATRGLVLGRDLEETVGVNLERADELGLATGLGGDAGKLRGEKRTGVRL